VLEVRNVPQVGVQHAHHVDDDLGVAVAFLAGGQRADVVHHVLHVAPVFGQDQFRPGTVVIEFHKKMCVCLNLAVGF